MSTEMRVVVGCSVYLLPVLLARQQPHQAPRVVRTWRMGSGVGCSFFIIGAQPRTGILVKKKKKKQAYLQVRQIRTPSQRCALLLV